MFIGNSLQGDAQIVTQFIIQDSNSCTWEYTIIADNEVEIKSVTGDIKIANIPSSVEYNGNDYNVSSIGKRAFYDCSSLLMVELPQSIKSIGDCAFYKCTLLKSIVIPNSVTNIGELAFCGMYLATSKQL
jgi:hypothetical protein